MHKLEYTMENPRILVLDDEPEIGRLISTLMTRSGYETKACLTGEEAVALFNEAEEKGSPFELLIMDLTIPAGMGGKEALQAIKEIREDIPAIATSGYDPVYAGVSESGFSHFIGKPFDISHLIQLVNEILTPES